METTLPQTNIAPPSAYRAYQGGYFTVLISPEQTDGALAMIDFRLPKGAEPPMHMHLQEDETFLVLEGEVTFYVGGEQIDVKAGEAAFGPRCVPHRFSIKTPHARIITTITPGDFANYFMEFSRPAAEAPALTPPQGPPPAEVIAQLIQRAKERFKVSFF